MVELLLRYSDIIQGGFFGHEHTDHLEILFDSGMIMFDSGIIVGGIKY